MIGVDQPLRPVLEAEHLGLDLGLPVRTHALQLVRLVQRMMVRYPVHRRRGDVDEALHAVPQRSIQDVAGALHVGRIDIFGRVQRQGRRRVDHEVGTLHSPVHHRLVPDVAPDYLDAVALGIIEVLHVEGGHGVAPAEKVSREVDPQEPRPAGDENSPLVHLKLLVGNVYPAHAGPCKRRILAFQHAAPFGLRLSARCFAGLSARSATALLVSNACLRPVSGGCQGVLRVSAHLVRSRPGCVWFITVGTVRGWEVQG